MLLRGLSVFAPGLCKQVCLADSLARASDFGFASATTLDFPGGWATALDCSLQLCFDFSGYPDIAIGLALVFGIAFPFNFDGPYRACDIRDFRRRWHMTLSGFLRDYVYVALGGIWHGAGWPFVIWGAMHGAGMVVHRLWRRSGARLPAVPAWPLSFLFVVLALVMFRAPDVATALAVCRALIDVGSFDPAALTGWRIYASQAPFVLWLNALDTMGVGLGGWLLILACLGLSVFGRNSSQPGTASRPTPGWALLTVVPLVVGVPAMQTGQPFIYLRF